MKDKHANLAIHMVNHDKLHAIRHVLATPT